jgi:guanine deaminase
MSVSRYAQHTGSDAMKGLWQVGLGTDCSGGPSIGILSAIRSASHVSKFLSFPSAVDQIQTPPSVKFLSTANLFYLATMGGAQLCRMEDRIGNLLPGKEFDALWVRPRSPGMFVHKGESVEAVFEKWIWGGDDRDLGAVWVRGRRVAGALDS